MQCRISRRSKCARGVESCAGRFQARERSILGNETSRQSPTFRFAVGAEFILLQRQQRVEHSLVPVNVFHRFARHHCTLSTSSTAPTVRAGYCQTASRVAKLKRCVRSAPSVPLPPRMLRQSEFVSRRWDDCLSANKHELFEMQTP